MNLKASIECPRCEHLNSLDNENCRSCFLPLNPFHLQTYSKNLKLQLDRIKDKENDSLLYEDKRIRVYPKEKDRNRQYSERIVYYKKRKFVLLDFFHAIWKKKAVIHFKIRPEKTLILYYPREHPWTNFFVELLEYFALMLGFELVDMREVFDKNMELEQKSKKAAVKLKEMK